MDLENRLRSLEHLQEVNVEAILSKILLEARSKSLVFTKDSALEQLLNLKVVAMEAKHEKAAYFSAVFQSLKDKMSVPEEQFKRYLIVLLGNKEEEKVFEKIAKIDKSARRQPQPQPRGNSSPRGRPLSSVRCFHCRGYGHYQRNCLERLRDSPAGQGSPAKRGRWSGSSQN